MKNKEILQSHGLGILSLPKDHWTEKKKKWNWTKGSSSSSLCLGLGWNPRTEAKRQWVNLASPLTWNLPPLPTLPHHLHWGLWPSHSRWVGSNPAFSMALLCDHSLLFSVSGPQVPLFKMATYASKFTNQFYKNNTCSWQSHDLRFVSPHLFHGIPLF